MNAIRRICLYISTLALLLSLCSPSFPASALVGKVTSVEGQYVELNIGANQGITVGDIGRVYYTVKVQGKDRPIYIAKFKVTHISQRSCMAQIDVRTGDLKVGLSAEIVRAGDLEVTSAPSGASVHINGKSAGVTPYEGKNYSPGSYKIRVEKEGYEAWEKQITVEAGRTSQVLADLAVLKIGELEVKSEPSGAKIYLDGKEVGETPSVLSKVNPGRHRVQLRKEGYVPFEETVEIKTRERARIEASLKRLVGGISVVTEPPGANVTIDGRRAGMSPYGGKELTPGKHKVRVDKEGYETWEGEVTVIAEKDVEVPVALRLKGGELVVQSEPPGARVYLTGKEIGDTPIKVSGIKPGVYELRVIKEGYAPHEAQVRVVGGRTETVQASLRKSAGSLLLRTDPAGANVYIDGKLVGVSPFRSEGLTPGVHRVQVSKEAYETQEKEVTVKANERAEVLISLKKTTGGLVIQTEPPGANVYVDGRSLGVTPYEAKELSPGMHRVRIVKEGYEAWEKEVMVEGGKKAARIEASLRRAMGGISVVTEPPGANVSIDGRRVGVSPYGGKGLTPGKHKVRVDKEGYETWEGEVTAIAEKDVEVPVALKLKGGELAVESEPPGAKVYLAGREIGDTPIKIPSISPGVYEIRLMKEGYAPHEGQVRIVGGRTETVQASLRKSVGSLLLRTEPAGANVHIDGKLAGVSPFQGEGLTPGIHRVQVSKEAYETQEKEVTVKANERAEVFISLKRTTGGLVIQTEPPGANVYVDGKSLGISPYEAKELPPGMHRVRIVKDGYEAWEKEVMVEGGKKAEIRSQLAKVAPPKSQESPPDSQTKVIPPKTEKLPPLKHDAPIWSVNDSWGYVNAEGRVWQTKVVKIEGDLFIVRNTGDDSLLGIDRGTLQAKVYITPKGKRVRDTELGDFQFKFPLEINKEWTQMITAVSPLGHMPGNFSNKYRVIANEDITVRAGKFRAFKIELKQVFVSGIRADMSSKNAYIWYCPEIKKEVKVLYEGHNWGNKVMNYELTSFALSQK